MRKQVAIAGHGELGLSLIPQLDANPGIEICAIVTPDPEATRAALRALGSELADRLDARVTRDLVRVLEAPELQAVVDAGAPPAWHPALAEASRRGVQLISPLLARLRYGFAPGDTAHRPQLLATLEEILDAYDLTADPAELLERILEIAIGASGASRGSVLLYDRDSERLRVAAATGIETELLPKISLAPGEGIAGRAFELRQAQLVTGKATPDSYRIAHERDDVESALAVPLLHADRGIGVLCVSRTKRQRGFGPHDLNFLEQFGVRVSPMIARARQHDALRFDASRLRAREAVQAVLAEPTPLLARLQRFCSILSRELEGGVCHLYLPESAPSRMRLRATSTGADLLDTAADLLPGEGHVGWVSQQRQPLHLWTLVGSAEVHDCTLPVEASGDLIGVLSLEGVSEPGAARSLRDRIDACVELLGRNLVDASREARTERKAGRAAAISDAALRMTSCREAAELQHLIAASAALILETDHAVLRLRDEISGTLEIRAYFGSAEADAQPSLFRLEHASAADVLRSGRARLSNELDRHPGSDAYDADVSNLMQEPIAVAGVSVGTLSVLEKHSDELVGGTTFTEADAGVLRQLALHAGQHLARIQGTPTTRPPQSNDPVTGPEDRRQFELRLDQELAQSDGEGRPLALIRLRIEGLGELAQRRGQAEADRVAGEISRELEGTLRDFDLVTRTNQETFQLLIPQPDEEISSLIGNLARRSAEPLRQLEQRSGDRLKLEFGYARFPEDGNTRAALTARSEQSRLRSFP